MWNCYCSPCDWRLLPAEKKSSTRRTSLSSFGSQNIKQSHISGEYFDFNSVSNPSQEFGGEKKHKKFQQKNKNRWKTSLFLRGGSCNGFGFLLAALSLYLSSGLFFLKVGKTARGWKPSRRFFLFFFPIVFSLISWDHRIPQLSPQQVGAAFINVVTPKSFRLNPNEVRDGETEDVAFRRRTTEG